MGLPSAVGDAGEAINNIPADVWVKLAGKKENLQLNYWNKS